MLFFVYFLLVKLLEIEKKAYICPRKFTLYQFVFMNTINLDNLKITVAVLVNKNNEIVDFDHVRGNRLNLIIGKSDVSFYHPESEQYRSGDLEYAEKEIAEKSEGELSLQFVVASKSGFSQTYTAQAYEKLLGKEEKVAEIVEIEAKNSEVETTEKVVQVVAQVVEEAKEEVKNTEVETKDLVDQPEFSLEIATTPNGVSVEVDGK